MIPRRQLPAYSPIEAGALIPALRSALLRAADHELLAGQLAGMFGALRVVPTDSGTSALVLALRALVGPRGTVALPGYACADLVAAALHARVKVRLYDIDPETLAPDLDSLSRVLDQGAAAVVVAHLYGVPVDVPQVIELAAAHGASVIEDAAQAAGGMLRGSRLGSFGALTVLSFGRGKGVTGGGGGALLTIAPRMVDLVESCAPACRIPRGWRHLAAAALQWAFGRPRLYAIPSAVPGLRLGEMVFHPAREPGPISAAAAALVRSALRAAEREASIRRRNAARLMDAVVEESGLAPIRLLPEGIPAYIRFPVRDLRHRFTDSGIGILRPYPRTLLEQEEIRECLESHQAALPGATDLARSLFTLPVHSLVSGRDLDYLRQWLRTPSVGSRSTSAVAPQSLEAMTARSTRRL